ncbi:MAG: T9SS type A sorting domain-containing protein [Bacteroidia bacterium]|nr:T9SS type A sorting domain-containing protein [Bacteroidia bacterium]
MKTQILLFCLFFCLIGWGLSQNTAAITRSDSSDCTSLTVDFDVVVTSGTATSFDWNFGDGNTSTLQNPTHTYSSTGIYFPWVTVSFATGTSQIFTFNNSQPMFVGTPRVRDFNFTFGNTFNTICGTGDYDFIMDVDSLLIPYLDYEWIVTFPNGSTTSSTQFMSSFDLDQVGTYTIEARAFFDPNCAGSYSRIITVDTLAFNPMITDANCGSSDGAISLMPSINGTNPSVNVNWSNGMTGTSISNLAMGAYSAEVIWGFQGGCTAIDTFYVDEIGTLDYSISTTNVPCELDSVGAIDITINASNGPVSFLWNTGDVSEDLSNIPAGTYTVTMTDNSCTRTEDIEIEADSLSVTFTALDSDCSGNGGSLEAFVSGGQSPYSFSWSNGVTTAINPNITAGGYSVVVTDATGCADREVAFVEPADTCAYTISGKVFYDENGNCILDGNDFYITEGWIKLNNGAEYVQLDPTGSYSFSVPPGSHTVAPSIGRSFPAFSISCPANGSFNPTVTLSDIGNLDFALTPDTNIIDLATSIYTNAIRPGFNHSYQIFVQNLGTVPMSGLLTFTHDSQVSYQNATPAPVNYDPQTRTAIFDFSNLLPSRMIKFTVVGQVSATTPLGTSINIIADVGPVTNDNDQSNNFYNHPSTVVGSFDPNDKQVFPAGEGPEGFIEPTENIMEYTIRFQNTGTFPAEFVVLRDTLDSDLDLESIKPVAASHPYKMRLKGDELEVRFDNINLPDSISDPEGSQGFFTFVIRHDGVLAPLTEISNQAAIYFDFNKPIFTNTVLSTIAEPSSILEPAKDGILIYPNPTHGLFQVNGLDANIQLIRVFDITGREVLHTNEQSIDLSQEKEGIYLVQIQTNRGIVVKRISLNK